MTCKDCYHCSVCCGHDEEKANREHPPAEKCKDFKDKSRIMELPCKVGDILYYPWVYGGTSGIAMLEVFSFKIYVQGRVLTVVKDPESDMETPKQFHLEDFGKTVFLTREEAEEALRKEEKKHDKRRAEKLPSPEAGEGAAGGTPGGDRARQDIPEKP